MLLNVNHLLARLNRFVGCFQAAFSVIMMLLLTAALCWFVACFLQLNPLFGVVFLLLGSLGVVLLVDMIQAQFFP